MVYISKTCISRTVANNVILTLSKTIHRQLTCKCHGYSVSKL